MLVGYADAVSAVPVLIAFEGGEGSGKSTQIEALAASLRADGTSGAGQLRARRHRRSASAIRELVLHTDEAIAPAGRGAAVRRRPGPSRAAPSSGRRSTPARSCCSIATSTRRWPIRAPAASWPRPRSAQLSHWATGGLRARPDRCVLDIAGGDGLARARGRSAADRLERESLEFHERVRAGLPALRRRRTAAISGARRRAVRSARSRPTVAAAVQPPIARVPACDDARVGRPDRPGRDGRGAAGRRGGRGRGRGRASRSRPAR